MTGPADEQLRTSVREAVRRHWQDLQAQPARQRHRAKAEAAFGASVLARMCEQVAPEAQRVQTRGVVVTEAKILERNAHGVVGHMKKALELVDGALKARTLGDARGWERLQGALESALVDARSIEHETKATFRAFLQHTRRRGAPSVRTEFLRIGSRFATATPASWAHLGIAAGIDEPKNGDEFRRLAEDYRRILRNPRR